MTLKTNWHTVRLGTRMECLHMTHKVQGNLLGELVDCVQSSCNTRTLHVPLIERGTRG
jgi:hypothetical protein